MTTSGALDKDFNHARVTDIVHAMPPMIAYVLIARQPTRIEYNFPLHQCTWGCQQKPLNDEVLIASR